MHGARGPLEASETSREGEGGGGGGEGSSEEEKLPLCWPGRFLLCLALASAAGGCFRAVTERTPLSCCCRRRITYKAPDGARPTTRGRTEPVPVSAFLPLPLTFASSSAERIPSSPAVANAPRLQWRRLTAITYTTPLAASVTGSRSISKGASVADVGAHASDHDLVHHHRRRQLRGRHGPDARGTGRGRGDARRHGRLPQPAGGVARRQQDRARRLPGQALHAHAGQGHGQVARRRALQPALPRGGHAAGRRVGLRPREHGGVPGHGRGQRVRVPGRRRGAAAVERRAGHGRL